MSKNFTKVTTFDIFDLSQILFNPHPNPSHFLKIDKKCYKNALTTSYPILRHLVLFLTEVDPRSPDLPKS